MTTGVGSGPIMRPAQSGGSRSLGSREREYAHEGGYELDQRTP